jgi:hypothetical protein
MVAVKEKQYCLTSLVDRQNGRRWLVQSVISQRIRELQRAKAQQSGEQLNQTATSTVLLLFLLNRRILHFYYSSLNNLE